MSRRWFEERFGAVAGGVGLGIFTMYAMANIIWTIWGWFATLGFYVNYCGPVEQVPEMMAPKYLDFGFAVLIAIFCAPLIIPMFVAEYRSIRRLNFYMASLVFYLVVMFALNITLGSGPDEAHTPFLVLQGCAFVPGFILALISGITGTYVYWRIAGRNAGLRKPETP